MTHRVRPPIPRSTAEIIRPVAGRLPLSATRPVGTRYCTGHRCVGIPQIGLKGKLCWVAENAVDSNGLFERSSLQTELAASSGTHRQ